MAQDNKIIQSLIESSRNGNINAFEQLFNMHVGFVYAISFRILADFEEANEITCKIFLEAWKTISMVRRDSPFILWLKAIAVYTSLQRLREKVKSKSDTINSKPNRKGLSFIDQELLSLPEPERIVFVLSEIERYKREEISDFLSISEEEVNNLLIKGREIIMETLVIKSLEALERTVKQIPETIDPLENLYIRFIDQVSKIINPVNNVKSESEQSKNNKGENKKSKQDKKRFSLKDFFKKKE